MANRKKKPGEFFGFNLIVSITVGSAALFFSVLITVLFIFNKNIDIDREILKFILTTVGVSGGITSAFYVGESFRENAKYKKQDKSMMYISAWTSPQFAVVRKSLRKVRNLIKGVAEEE
ncbi:MAG: hypothetical protein V7K71_23130 [Nostoc sp.]|uniref:hypothetical protein n=1 Tax=Nostoc sp. TaxID=1180 RepID=UPI002FFB2721